jgi:hypothetical protein
VRGEWRGFDAILEGGRKVHSFKSSGYPKPFFPLLFFWKYAGVLKWELRYLGLGWCSWFGWGVFLDAHSTILYFTCWEIPRNSLKFCPSSHLARTKYVYASAHWLISTRPSRLPQPSLFSSRWGVPLLSAVRMGEGHVRSIHSKHTHK